MNEIVPDNLTVLPDPRLFRAARWTQRICLGVAGIGILLGLVEIPIGGNLTSVVRASLAFFLTAASVRREPAFIGARSDWCRDRLCAAHRECLGDLRLHHLLDHCQPKQSDRFVAHGSSASKVLPSGLAR